MIIDKAADQLAPEERVRLDKAAETIKEYHATQRPDMAGAIKSLRMPYFIATLAQNIITAADAETDYSTYQEAAERYFSIYQAGEDRYLYATASRGGKTPAAAFIEDAVEVLRAAVPEDATEYYAGLQTLSAAFWPGRFPDVKEKSKEKKYGYLLYLITELQYRGAASWGGKNEENPYTTMLNEQVYNRIRDFFPAPVAVSSRRSKVFLAPTSQLAAKVFAHRQDSGKVTYEITEIQKHKGKTVTELQVWDPTDNANIAISGPLTAYEIQYHNAAGTLYRAGNEYVTQAQIYALLTGKPEARLSPKAREELEAAFTRVSSRNVRIDDREAAAALGYDALTYKGSMLPAELVTAELNGAVADCIHFLREPPIFTFAEARNQISRTPTRLLASPLRKTPETIALTGYLLRRINAMIASPKLSRTILYQTTYDELQIDAANVADIRGKRLYIRKSMKTILEYWVQENFIKSFTEKTKGRHGTAQGVEIELFQADD